MKVHFRSFAEARPGPHWKALVERAWPSYRAWYLSEGEAARPDLATSRAQLLRYMPQLLPLLDELVGLGRAVVGGGEGEGDLLARMLGSWCPPPYVSGCSQAVFGGSSPFLIRNYDYHPNRFEATFLHSTWTGSPVIASSDCLWGVLDGMNDAGLTVALSFGGRRIVGEGFGIPLILRYVLEVARSTIEAVTHLVRIPCHMAYNVSLLDLSGNSVVVALAPDRPPLVTTQRVATNHQGAIEWPEYEQHSRSLAREAFLENLLGDPAQDAEALTSAFLAPPLFERDYARGFGTLYTARYEPLRGEATFFWQGARWKRSFAAFEEGELVVGYLPAGG